MIYKLTGVKIYFTILLMLLSLSIAFAEPGTKVLKPNNAKTKTTVIVSGKNRTYYPLELKEHMLVTVKGPGLLKVISRVQFDYGTANSINYPVYYRVNGTQKIRVDFYNISRDPKAKFRDESVGRPGTAEHFVIELSRGDNTIEFMCSYEKPKIYLRFIFTPVKEKKTEWVPLCPQYPNQPVTLITNEEMITYYRFSKKNPLKIKITGPTVLRLLNRIENHYQMKGRINYRLQVKEDGNVKNTYQLSSVRSDVTVYKKPCGKTPGKAKEIIIRVPDGTHTYEIIPLDKDKDEILGRVQFPKKDVKLKE